MKSFRTCFLFFLCSLCMTITVTFSSAAAKASEASTGILEYQAKEMSWDGETVTVKGSLVNTTSEKDITAVNSASVILKDSAGKEIAATTLNSGSLGEVTLAPGEKWSYTIVRTVPGFRSSDYSLKSGFQVSLSSDITISAHQKNCAFCRSRGTPSMETEDTMSQEEWEALKEKLALALKGGSSSSVTSSSSGTSSGADFYFPDTSVSSSSGNKGKKICPKCSGAGYYICDSCKGMGYKERQERMTCLVAHHTDCTFYAIHKCNGCHERHDIRTVRDKCLRCGGDGKVTCSQCFGAGFCY